MKISITMALLGIVSMMVITYLLRAFPTIVPRRFIDSPILKVFNYHLPLSVMMVLILASLNIVPSALNYSEILAKLLALITVLISYIVWRNVLVSIIVGVASVNGFLWLFPLLG